MITQERLDSQITYTRETTLGKVRAKVSPIFDNIESAAKFADNEQSLFLLELIADLRSALIDSGVKL